MAILPPSLERGNYSYRATKHRRLFLSFLLPLRASPSPDLFYILRSSPLNQLGSFFIYFLISLFPGPTLSFLVVFLSPPLLSPNPPVHEQAERTESGDVFIWWPIRHLKAQERGHSVLNGVVVTEYIIIIIIYPLTARVVEAPQMILQLVSSILPCSQLPSGTWRTPGLQKFRL